MGWDAVKDMGSADFVQLEAGVPIKVHVLLKDGEEPESYFVHFVPEANEGKGQSVICPGSKVCPCCANKGAYPLRMRHAVNVFDYTDNTVKILEGGNAIFKRLKETFDEYGNLNDIDFKITKKGSGLKTEYVVVAIPTKFAEDIDSLELKDLTTLSTATDPDDITTLLDGGTVSKNNAVAEDATPASAGKKVPSGKMPPRVNKAGGKKTPNAEEDTSADEAAAVGQEAGEDELPVGDAINKKLIEQINESFVTMDRYNNPQFIKTDMAEATKPSKKMVLSAFTVPELKKLIVIQNKYAE